MSCFSHIHFPFPFTFPYIRFSHSLETPSQDPLYKDGSPSPRGASLSAPRPRWLTLLGFSPNATTWESTTPKKRSQPPSPYLPGPSVSPGHFLGNVTVLDGPYHDPEYSNANT